MIVVADASPLNYLVIIDEVELLPAIFGRVLLPQAVFNELQEPGTSPKVRDWVVNAPSWIETHHVTTQAPPPLITLDPGEREAIQLALELGIGTILMDESQGRKQAELLNLEVRGTLGILERGSAIGKTNFHHALTKLLKTNFRASPALIRMFLQRNP
jgi:predicted nucleic acid-binding protein